MRVDPEELVELRKSRPDEAAVCRRTGNAVGPHRAARGGNTPPERTISPQVQGDQGFGGGLGALAAEASEICRGELRAVASVVKI